MTFPLTLVAYVDDKEGGITAAVSDTSRLRAFELFLQGRPHRLHFCARRL